MLSSWSDFAQGVIVFGMVLLATRRRGEIEDMARQAKAAVQSALRGRAARTDP